MAKKAKKKVEEEKMITVGYQPKDSSGVILDEAVAPVRHWLGIKWKTGDVNEIPEHFKGAIDEGMEAIGFYIK